VEDFMRLYLFLLVFGFTATTQHLFKPNGNPYHNFETATAFDGNCTTRIGNAKPYTGGAWQNRVKNNLGQRNRPKTSR
jgi:hypothetical protein